MSDVLMGRGLPYPPAFIRRGPFGIRGLVQCFGERFLSSPGTINRCMHSCFPELAYFIPFGTRFPNSLGFRRFVVFLLFCSVADF